MSTFEDPRTGAPRTERRRGLGRRREDESPVEQGEIQAKATPVTAAWAIIGAAVVLYLFFLALAGVDPGDAKVASIIAAVLALAWLVHSWRRLWAPHLSPRRDRERRGF